MTPLQFSPSLPWPLLAALALVTLTPCLAALLSQTRGAAFRLTGTLLLLIVLCGPHLLKHRTAPLPDVAIILADQSQSMTIGNRQILAAHAQAALQSSAGATRLEIVDIPPAAAGGTALTPALAQALANIQPSQLAGIIVVTDGEISDSSALPRNVPITALLTAKGEETDRELRLLNIPSYGLVGQSLKLNLMVIDHGIPNPAGAAAITISEDGTPLLNTQVPIGTPATVTLPIRHDGPTIVTAAVAPLPGEVSLVNNQAAFTLNGIHKRLNVLLISGAPDQGERAWRRLLKSDPAIQLIHFTILRLPGEATDADPQDMALIPFPIRELFETDLSKFNLIILDSFNPDGLLPANYLQNITSFVQHGGALLTEAGPEFNAPDSLAFTPLGAVIPATPSAGGAHTEAFTPSFTPIGTRHPVTAPFAGAALPPWYRMEPATQTAGDVLMTGANNLPLLILASAGAGRSCILLSDQLWLWTRGGNHTGPALPLLRRIVHWLLREPALEAESLAASIGNQHLTVTRQTLSPVYPGDVAITAPNGATTTIPLHQSGPGLFTGSIDSAAAGVWKITEGNLTAYAANSDSNTEEFQNLAATSANFRGIARSIIWLGNTPAPALGPLISPRHAEEITGTKAIPLLPPLPTLVLALILIVAGWWRESQSS